MKTLLKKHFTFFAFLVAFSFSLQSFGQPPTVRKEANDGGSGGYLGSPNCLDPNEDENYIAYQILLVDLAYLEDCQLQVKITKGDSLITWLLDSTDFHLVSGDTIYQFNFLLSFNSQETDAICQGEPYDFSINLSCLGDEGRETNEPNPNSLYPTCCEADIEDEGEPNNVDPGGYLLYNPEVDGFEKNIDKEFSPIVETHKTVDYYLYDINGNMIDLLENISITVTIQEAISNLNITTGIYFIRYWDGSKMTSQKVFKL